jgi:hypothetical protein
MQEKFKDGIYGDMRPTNFRIDDKKHEKNWKT